MKKLLVLSGIGPHLKVVEAAKEMGIYTIVADYTPNAPAKFIADEVWDVNLFDTEKIIKLGKANRINGVIGLAVDPAQKPAQIIAEALNLPNFGTLEQVNTLTDKKLFKKLCIENGVDVIPEYTIYDLDKDIYPVLVKPSNSRGSRGISICYKKDDVLSAISKAAEYSLTGEFIIEKYMENKQDLTISYIVKDGRAVLVSIGDRYSGDEENLRNQLVCTIQPSRYAEMFVKKVDSKIKNMIRKLGIKNGPVFFQGFVDGDTVRLYDPGIRFPGNEFERIHCEATGKNLVKSIISYCIGEEIDDYDGGLEGSYDLNGMVAMQYMINARVGTIKHYDGLNEIRKLPYVIDVQQKKYINNTIKNTGDIGHRIGEISVLVHRDCNEMMEAIAEIQSLLRIIDVEGDDQINSPFDKNIIKENYAHWNKSKAFVEI